MTIGNIKMRGRRIDLDDVLQIVFSARDTCKQRINMDSIEELEMIKTVVEEVDQVATVLFITHYNWIVGECERLQVLPIKANQQHNDKR